MQNLFICKFSALKIQFFRPYPFSLPPARHFPPIRLATRPRSSPASRLLDLGGTRALVHAAWYGEGLADEQNGMCTAFRTGKPGVAERNAQCRLFGSGNVASPVQSSFLGIVPVGVYCQICILKKCCHADCGRRTLWGESAPDGRRTFLRHVRTRRSQNPCWGARAPTLIGARTQTAGAGHLEARTDGATLRRTTRQVLLNQR